MKTIGSQKRETLNESGYKLIRIAGYTALLQDSDGKKELWRENDNFAGYVIEVNGKGYEFVSDWNY